MKSWICLVLAIAFLCMGHFIRIMRWKLFISVYERPNDRNLVQALAIGYFLNYVLPYKLGDIVRAWLAGTRMKNGKALGFSTVIVDRYLDVICVGLIFGGFFLSGTFPEDSRNMAIFYMGSGLVFILLMGTIFAFNGIAKKCIRRIAKIFNTQIEAAILQFFWALVWNLKDIFHKINKIRLVGTTMSMWAGYLISYRFFAMALHYLDGNVTWQDVFFTLFSQNGIKESTGFLLPSRDFTHSPAVFILYTLTPLVIFLGASFFMRKSDENINDRAYLRLLPHLNPNERRKFLENYFSNDNREYINTYLEINRGVSIVRDFSAGSNATTILCMDAHKMFFRKYALGEDGEKLYQQILWIERNKDALPLPKILHQSRTDHYCYYDMQYNPNAVGLFEYAHSTGIEKTWAMIVKALSCLENSIYQTNVKKADHETIVKYIETKVNKNLQKIKGAHQFRKLQRYNKIVINGLEYDNLTACEKYLTKDYLTDVFADDSYAVIHGDLTIENIICIHDNYGDGFYIIDPNTGNVHNSPNLDYAKLLQSVHGGYEFLMTTGDVNIQDNHIDFPFTYSAVYAELHNKLGDYLKKFGFTRSRSVYFHEIIHWIRLMPYKIEKDGKRAALFYARMLMVMNDVIKMYGVQDK